MNKTIIITGSTDGIGKLAAAKLAAEGHTIYLHGRNAEKLANVILELKATTNNNNIDGFVADFSDLNAVRTMAKEIQEKINSIDVLINNAGVFKSNVQNAIDIRFGVNYLAPYVLTNELIPLLKKGTNARIVNLSSAAQAPVSLEALKGKQSISVNEAYAQSKLALTMWSFDMAQKYPEINVIAVNPGSLLNTNMVKEAYGHHWSSADKGATILYQLAVSEAHANNTGKYFDNDKGSYGKAHSDAYNEGKIKALLATTETII